MDFKNYNSFLDNFSGDKQKLIYLMDKVKIAEKTWGEVYTDFLTPEEQSILKKLCISQGLNVTFIGGKGEFERAAAALSMQDSEIEFPVDTIKITGNFKFEKVTHRDYLGALLSLGIRREKIGDINVYEDGSEVWLHRDVCDFVCLNLNKIKNTGIKVEKITYHEAREKIQNFRQQTINVASMRLDTVVSSLINASRTIASSIVKSGNVKVNHVNVEDISKKIGDGDLISIKGYGRYVIERIVRTTRSDRMVLSVKQYI